MNIKLKLTNKYQDGVDYVREYDVIIKDYLGNTRTIEIVVKKTNSFCTHWNMFREWTITKGDTLDGLLEFAVEEPDCEFNSVYGIDAGKIESIINNKHDLRKWIDINEQLIIDGYTQSILMYS